MFRICLMLALNHYTKSYWIDRCGDIPPTNIIFSLTPLYSPNPRLLAATTLN
jgi:hypothetical protein